MLVLVVALLITGAHPSSVAYGHDPEVEALKRQAEAFIWSLDYADNPWAALSALPEDVQGPYNRLKNKWNPANVARFKDPELTQLYGEIDLKLDVIASNIQKRNWTVETEGRAEIEAHYERLRESGPSTPGMNHAQAWQKAVATYAADHRPKLSRPGFGSEHQAAQAKIEAEQTRFDTSLGIAGVDPAQRYQDRISKGLRDQYLLTSDREVLKEGGRSDSVLSIYCAEMAIRSIEFLRPRGRYLQEIYAAARAAAVGKFLQNMIHPTDRLSVADLSQLSNIPTPFKVAAIKNLKGTMTQESLVELASIVKNLPAGEQFEYEPALRVLIEDFARQNSRTLESVAEALGIPLPRAETPVLEPRLGFWNRLRSLWGRCWALSRGRPGR